MKIKPSDLRIEALRLIQSGEMPSLDEVLKAVAEIRQKYRPEIEQVRSDNGASE